MACRTMFPHERSLVKRYEKAPFALLGVSLDPSRELLKKTEQKEGLTWRNWWDGENSLISSQWKVDAMPTLYLIDARGIIRYSHIGVPDNSELEREIDKLIHEAADIHRQEARNPKAHRQVARN